MKNKIQILFYVVIVFVAMNLLYLNNIEGGIYRDYIFESLKGGDFMSVLEAYSMVVFYTLLPVIVFFKLKTPILHLGVFISFLLSQNFIMNVFLDYVQIVGFGSGFGTIALIHFILLCLYFSYVWNINKA